ncbi:MAG: sialidase family protein, partial [Actinomycetota bacterium]
MIRSTRLAVGLTTAAVMLGAGLSTAFAATALDVQANNPQIAHPLPDTSGVFPNNKQNEPTIAVSPDGVHLVAGANDEQEQPDCGPGPRRGPTLPSNCSFFDGVGTDGVYISSDRGATWTNTGLIDRQAAWVASPFVSDGDPVVAFGPGPDGHGGFTAARQRVYYQSLASYKAGRSPFNGGFGGAETIVISHSDDFGLTWSAPVIAGPRANPITFNDKNAMAVDDIPGSRFYGRVYSSWTSFRSATSTGNGNEPVLTAYSPDGGATFSAAKQLSPAGNNGTGNGRQGSAIATTPDGTAMVAFEQGAAQVVAVSRDGGVRWSRPG